MTTDRPVRLGRCFSALGIALAAWFLGVVAATILFEPTSSVVVVGPVAAAEEVSVAEEGAIIDIRPGYESFWMYIPHFIHSPFYVYAYAFGDCLVNSLYAVYENAQAGFAERYLAMLAAGGTKHYSELLKPFGLDARDPQFWDGGLSVIAGMIDELERMG